MTKSRDIANSTSTLDVDGGTIKLDGNYPTGTGNVALGDAAFAGSLSGDSNVALGYQSHYSLTSGNANTSVGRGSGFSTTTGVSNVAVGYTALASNTTASYNTAVGYQAGVNNTGLGNTFIGMNCGRDQTSGERNTYIGWDCGLKTTTGTRNTFLGQDSGLSITTGSKNTILGRYNGNQNGLDIRTSSNNIVLSDGDGVPRFVSDSNGEFEIGGTPAVGTSNAIFKVIKRGAGNSSETFTAADMGMSDNITAMIHINIGGDLTFNAYGAAVIYWYMPRGGISVIHQNVVTLFKGSGVSTFSRSVSGNSLVVSKDSNLPVSITVIGGGGLEDAN